MKRLTLVNPSKGFNTGCFPIGLASISAYLKKYMDNIEVKLLDSNCQDIFKEYDPNTQVVAITAVTQDLGEAIQFARFVKTIHPLIPVILGGVHISTYRILPEPFDIGVIGEGEETMLELMQLDTRISKESVQNIRGLCFNIDGETHFTEFRPLIEPLDKIPLPDYSIFNMNYYLLPRKTIPYHTGRTLSMMTSRGCPFKCVFCSTQVHWKKFRGFSASRVIEDMETLLDYGAEIIVIYDDLFIADKKRFSEIHAMVLEKGINEKAKFMCLVRSDMIDDKTMTMLKEMNVVVIGIGMESGCPKMLDYLKKRTTTIESNRKAIELSNKYNIPTLGSFMIGNPGETEEELLQTLAFVREYRYSPYLSPLSYISTAFPGTEFWDYAKEKGIDVEDFDNITMDIPSDINELAYAPLLTDIPVRRFFEIAQMFKKEQRYGTLKRYIFHPTSILDYPKAFAIGVWIERNPFSGIMEVGKIFRNYFRYKNIADRQFVPVAIPNFNYILDDGAREHYRLVIDWMFRVVPKMMKRKIPRANVQQAFIFNAVHTLVSKIKDPKILCIGSYEDTASECLKKLGYTIDEIDPAINYDLDSYFQMPSTLLESYDIIFSTSVIEHVDDDELFMGESSGLLKRGGVLLLTCDFKDSYSKGDKLPVSDVRFYTKNDMNRLCSHARNCSLIDNPDWDAIPDFKFNGCLYSFATLVLRKDTLK